MSSTSHSDSLSSWLAILSLAVTSFAMVTTEFLPIGLLTNISHSLQVSDGTAGLMVTLPGITAAISALLVGVAAGRLDRRNLMLLLTGLLLISNLLSALSVNFTMMLASRLLLGVCVGGFWSFATNYGRHLVPAASQGKAIAVILTGVSIGLVCGVPVGALMGDFLGWRSAFYATGLLSLLVLFAQLRLLRSVPAEQVVSLRDIASPLGLPMARVGLLAIGLLFIGHFSAYTYLKPLLLNVFALSPAMISLQLLVFGLIGILGTFIGERLASRSLHYTFILIVGLLALILLVSPWLSGIFGASLLVGIWGLVFGAVPVCATNWMFAAVPKAPEAGQSLLVFVIQVAIASGSLLGGEMVNLQGISGAIMFGGLVMLCSLFIFGLSLRVKVPCAQE